MADEWKDPIVYSDQVKEQMAADPDLAEAMRNFAAIMRQAHMAWKEGKYASFDAAMEALTGQKPQPISDEKARRLGLEDC